MAEYIEKARLRLMKVEECAWHTIEYAKGWKACIDWLKTLPTVEIIHCKDCKHFIRDITSVAGHYDGCDEWTDNGNEIMVAEDDFCSYAERREDA